MPSSKLRLATCSPSTQATTAETLVLLSQIAQRAAAQHVDLLLLPEAFLGGYPRGTNFGCVFGSRSDEGRNEYLRYFQAAVDLGDTVGDGAGAGDAWLRRELPIDVGTEGETGAGRRGDGTREELEAIAKNTGVFLVVGLIEKAGGSLYCSAVYVCPKLGVVGKRRKVQPTGTERLVWAQGSPATLRAVSTVIRGVRVNLAAAICWESYMPLLRQALYSQNINLYLAPTADGRDGWLSLMRTVGAEGRCFVLSSNMCVRSPNSSETTNGTSVKVDGHHPPSNREDGEQKSSLASTRTNLEEIAVRRRNSAITGEGFDMPPSNQRTSTSISPQRSPRSRRKSVFDADGNQIVLCCNEEVIQEESSEKSEAVAAGTNGTTSPGTEKSTMQPQGRFKMETRTRRKSVFDADGNQIVLCCDEDGKDVRSGVKTAMESHPQSTTQNKPVVANGTNFIARGGSCIISPSGDVVAGPQWEDPDGIIYADVDFEDCIRGRLDLDVGGSYSRNDSFKFSVQGLDLNPLPY